MVFSLLGRKCLQQEHQSTRSGLASQCVRLNNTGFACRPMSVYTSLPPTPTLSSSWEISAVGEVCLEIHWLSDFCGSPKFPHLTNDQFEVEAACVYLCPGTHRALITQRPGLIHRLISEPSPISSYHDCRKVSVPSIRQPRRASASTFNLALQYFKFYCSRLCMDVVLGSNARGAEGWQKMPPFQGMVVFMTYARNW